MNDQVTSFEVAKLAKEKEFKGNSFYCHRHHEVMYYHKSGGLYAYDFFSSFDNMVIAPTQSLLQKYLREKHEIIVTIGLDRTTAPKYFYEAYKYSHFGNYDGCNSKFTYRTYEEALEEGLMEGLKLIKV